MPTQTLFGTGEIEEILVDFIRRELAGDATLEIDPDENLLTGGLVDSVGIMRLIAHLQERLGIEIPPADLVPVNFRTPRVMAAYLHGRQDA